VAGAVVGTLGIVLAVIGLQEAADRSLASPVVWGSLGVGAAALVGFVRLERRAADPLVDPRLLGRVGYRRPVVAALVANVGFGALQLLLTFELQGQDGWSALATGMAFLAYSVPFALTGGLLGRLTERRSLTTLTAVGLAVVAASFAVLTLLGPLPALAVAGSLLVGGVGQGLVYSASSSAAMGAVPETDAGAASGVLGVARNLGLAVGIAVATVASTRPDDVVTGATLAAGALAVVTAATAAWTRSADPHPDVD
jgi:predicted MFS family arabinose efflux permease